MCWESVRGTWLPTQGMGLEGTRCPALPCPPLPRPMWWLGRMHPALPCPASPRSQPHCTNTPAAATLLAACCISLFIYCVTTIPVLHKSNFTATSSKWLLCILLYTDSPIGYCALKNKLSLFRSFLFRVREITS